MVSVAIPVGSTPAYIVCILCIVKLLNDIHSCTHALLIYNLEVKFLVGYVVVLSSILTRTIVSENYPQTASIIIYFLRQLFRLELRIHIYILHFTLISIVTGG